MSDGPWVDVPHLWRDQKAYMNWLRSQTRRMWSRHPIKNEYIKTKRFKAPLGRNGREVWCVQCEECNITTNKYEVDHIIPGGSFQDWESYTEWARRILWVMFKDLRLLCIPCHQTITYADKYGLSVEEAIAQKQAITILKEKKDKTWLECHNITPARNQKERRVQIVKKLLDGGSFIESNNKGGGSK